MTYKAVIFDLDGTLLDTISDIAESVNSVLRSYDFPEHSEDEYRYKIGGGISHLVEEALPDKFKGDSVQISRYTSEVRKQYHKNWNRRTKPYDGIVKLLKMLSESDILFSILSNKPQDLTDKSVEFFFPDISFSYVLGAGDRFPLKPDPVSSEYLCREMKSSKKETLFVGDSGVDILCAKNAGITSIGVNWGFRNDEFALADHIADQPADILSVIQG